jgi:hypothetical protein
VALPAVIGSRVLVGDEVMRLLERGQERRLLRPCASAWGRETERLESVFLDARLDGDARARAGAAIGGAKTAAAKWWSEAHDGAADAEPADGLVRAVDEEDKAAALPPLPHGRLQHILSGIVDEEVHADLDAQGSPIDRVRLRELADADVSFDWMWAVNPIHGPVLGSGEGAKAVAMVLGADLVGGPTCCACCGKTVAADFAAHALACAWAARTVGHNEVRDLLLDFVVQADGGACYEQGVYAGKDRPADILTFSALSGGKPVALDIGIASPFTAAAGDDCCAFYHDLKVHKYFAKCAAEGVEFRPLIFSAFGRPHPDCLATLRTIAAKVARRRGIEDPSRLVRLLLKRVATLIWRRNARMVAACLPGGDEEAVDAFAPLPGPGAGLVVSDLVDAAAHPMCAGAAGAGAVGHVGHRRPRSVRRKAAASPSLSPHPSLANAVVADAPSFVGSPLGDHVAASGVGEGTMVRGEEREQRRVWRGGSGRGRRPDPSGEWRFRGVSGASGE